ncbi:MAG: two-component sensor histidine kinase [Polaromonas sp. 24-62-144]|jgi:two-component system sensor histidine kinase GlrK|uniref:ATP-binding protein n=1 Tax=Polaromonas sp. TaxID=1869339 RepID=UPI000BDCA7CD|nr:HAMP domain-containing sensor histidine kinase [Polaromonas sp.]OYY53032.1 MAG: two-component sensor histidine kinase [Polaromonas sp. 35-63-240]OYY96150.1 MAG: two-component sensor histidine kinase [Polaromonas sp. 28-63-22]OYZ83343.1 MAG: two-component sensor histidine kinase [Polaromonas sp. 24-62-144]HQS30734.1 HAMP domain-containing sensor histidine kinase [Polaromonas sp.]HQS89928.1 HAMP domain-containing sensor histidine kinase [Polaromonas sp.]
MLQRFSFRQLLVIAFLLIAALLGAASLRALFTLEDITLQSRDNAARALELSGAAQSLGERSVSMERASRQSVVLDDRVLRGRFNDEARDAAKIIATLESEGLPRATGDKWRAHLEKMGSLLSGTPDTALERERLLAQEFRELEFVNNAISAQVQQAIQQRNKSLEGRLDTSRKSLTQQVSWAIALAVAMALAFGIWFTLPLRRLEDAIVGLGENRLDQAIAIQGPADLALIGQRLDWLRLRLVELDADKSRFLRHISHELKTPLASMREGVSLLEDGVAGELSHDQREIAQILRHNTALLQNQIEDLLRFNTAAFEARQLHRQSIDLLQLLEEQVDAQRLQWRARDLSVSVVGEPVQIALDPEKIGTAVANLLSNAIRYSPLKGHIRLELVRLPGLVRIDFHDQGIGVAQADRERIFEPFYRGERQPQDVVRGSGIGLSIVHEYVAAHGGRIELLPDQPGAHFRIELPHVFKS